ncbi:hypothetical protein F4813DRAFT_396788 [Daldinia decipiens]|uniref:uncharacterized protein n=1 Tax=Daldinia decipiens TaxID=326647 RepID=UPI0020C26031|nr:uncharacterized protein F4813DRAFT_396788 [Daldinia decipiens]KAI1662104.1 hypothetical protein F4813DRAFT_396788 [Daldinia decipiens]
MPSLPINRAIRRDFVADRSSCWIEVPNLDGSLSVHLTDGPACEQYELVNHNFCDLDPSFKSIFQHGCPPPLLGADPTTAGRYRPVQQSGQQTGEQYGALALIFAGGFLSIIIFAMVMYHYNMRTRYIYEPGYDED